MVTVKVTAILTVTVIVTVILALTVTVTVTVILTVKAKVTVILSVTSKVKANFNSNSKTANLTSTVKALANSKETTIVTEIFTVIARVPNYIAFLHKIGKIQWKTYQNIMKRTFYNAVECATKHSRLAIG